MLSLVRKTLVVAVLMSGCASLPPPTEVQAIDDPFRPFVEYHAGLASVAQWESSATVRLVGRIDRKTREPSTHVFVEMAYTSETRRHYETARNIRAELLAVTKHAGSGNCGGKGPCPHGEVVTIHVPIDDLRRAGPQGYALKLFAKYGPEATLTMPKPVIDAMLARLDKDRGAPVAISKKS
jgi:hypothetical protein